MLHMDIAVLLVKPGASEGDPFSPTIVVEVVIDELALSTVIQSSVVLLAWL